MQAMKPPCERFHIGYRPQSTATVEHMFGDKSFERVCTEHANQLERDPSLSQGPVRIVYDAVEPYREPNGTSTHPKAG